MHPLDISPGMVARAEARHGCARGFDAVPAGGAPTGIRCGNSARDTMMRHFRIIATANRNAANGDARRDASLASFWNIFGKVMTVDHVIERPRIGAAGKAAA